MSHAVIVEVRGVLFAAVCVALIGAPAVEGMAEKTTDVNQAAEVVATGSVAAPAPVPVPVQMGRPPVLLPLYVSFATLQGLDVHSTLRVTRFGGREANPVVAGMVGSPGAFIAAKAGVATGVIYLTERLWKRNKAAAIVTMVALNSAYGAIVAHNYAIERAAGRR